MIQEREAGRAREDIRKQKHIWADIDMMVNPSLF